MHQYIMLSYRFKYILAVAYLRYGLRNIYIPFQMVEPFERIQLHEERKVYRACDPVYVVMPYRQLFFQYLHKTRIGIGCHFESYDLTPLAALYLLFDLLEKIGCFFLVYRKVGISHYPVRIRAEHIIIEEELGHVPLYDFLEQYERPAFRRRYLDYTAETSGNLNGRKIP